MKPNKTTLASSLMESISRISEGECCKNVTAKRLPDPSPARINRAVSRSKREKGTDPGLGGEVINTPRKAGGTPELKPVGKRRMKDTLRPPSKSGGTACLK